MFIGHYEDDGRDKIICDLIADRTINFMLFGSEWHRSALYGYICKHLGEITTVFGEDYNKILNKSKIGLCLFSTLNNDTYTRRTFEIPAACILLLSQFTEDSANLLTPDKEAIYFNSTAELLDKVHFYISHDLEREWIAHNGYHKIIHGGHTYIDRAKQILKWVEDFLSNREVI